MHGPENVKKIHPTTMAYSGCVSTNRSAGVFGCSCDIFELNHSTNCRWHFMSCASIAFGERYSKVSQTETINMFYRVICWTQKVHSDFIFLCSIALPPVGHSSNHECHCQLKTIELWFEFLSNFRSFHWTPLIHTAIKCPCLLTFCRRHYFFKF